MPPLYRANVTSTEDPKHLGRVRVRFSGFGGESGGVAYPETTWLRVIQPYAGDHHGALFLPEVGDEVLVLPGEDPTDLHHMYVLGSVYHGKAKPPKSSNDPGNPLKCIRTKAGNQLTFSDREGHEYIQLKTDLATFTVHGDGHVTLKAPGGLTLDAPVVTVLGKLVEGP